MEKKIIARRLFWTTLLMVFCVVFSVFSQENGEGDDAPIDKKLRREILREYVRQEKLRWREEDRKEQETETEKNFSATFHPLALLSEGSFKFDFNARLAKQHWLQVTPAVYFSSGITSSHITFDFFGYARGYDNEYNCKTLYGAGISIGYKYYPLSSEESFYLLGGTNYSHFEAGYDFFVSDKADLSGTQCFNNLRAFACFGIQTPMRKSFFVGWNLGIGYQYSFYNENKPAFNKTAFDYGYRGVYPVLEFYLGYAW